MELVKERKTPLLGRTRYTFMIQYDGPTPARKGIVEEVAKKVKKDAANVVVKHIYTRYGSHEGKIIAHVYDDPSLIPKLEHSSMVEKHKPKEPEEGEEAAPAEAPAESAEGGEEKAEAAEEAEDSSEEKPAEASEETSEEKPDEEKKEE